MVEGREPPRGTPICLGFDGASVDDHAVIRAETMSGWQWTPTYGPDRRRTHWVPAEWDGRIPRSEIHAAIDEIFGRYKVFRAYCDPRDYQTEIEGWALKYGEDVVIPWPTYRIVPMHAALERFVTDLTTGALTHDGDPLTAVHVGNARKLAKPGDRYILGKPSQSQKIDAAVTSVLAHEAASDARAAGLDRVTDSRVFVFT